MPIQYWILDRILEWSHLLAGILDSTGNFFSMNLVFPKICGKWASISILHNFFATHFSTKFMETNISVEFGFPLVDEFTHSYIQAYSISISISFLYSILTKESFWTGILFSFDILVNLVTLSLFSISITTNGLNSICHSLQINK